MVIGRGLRKVTIRDYDFVTTREWIVYSSYLLTTDLKPELRTKEHSGYKGPLNSMSYLVQSSVSRIITVPLRDPDTSWSNTEGLPTSS